ncbi:MAG: hypothetical protein QOF40_2559 [Actinomycetota bacterium]|nr:hypothetical protein [Actinomycetota bacterium]
MTIAVILILGVLWIAVLVPPILRARGQQSRSDSVGDFTYKLSTLGRANGSHRERPSKTSSQRPMFAPMGPGPAQMSAAQKRRRDVLLILLGVAAATLFLAVLTRSMPFFALQLLADAALGGYVYLLIQHKQRAQEQQAKVRFLGSAYREPTPYFNGYAGAGGESSGPRLVPLRQTASS